MIYEGVSKVFDNNYIDAHAKACATFSNVITGVPFPYAASGASSVIDDIAEKASKIIGFKGYNSLNYMKGKEGLYILLPFIAGGGKHCHTNGQILTLGNSIVERSVWRSIRSIKAKTLRCTGCGSVYDKEGADSPVCLMCGAPYSIKASKDFSGYYKPVPEKDIYHPDVVGGSGGDCQCALINVKELVDEYNFLRGYSKKEGKYIYER
jgi:hypothetical protein